MNSLNWLLRICFWTAVLALAAAPSALFAQADHIFVNFGPIKGESTDVHHVDWVEAVSCTDGIANGSIISGSRVPTFWAIKIVKSVDRASMGLRLAAAQGTHLPDVEIHFVRGPDPDPFLYLDIRLDDVQLTEVSATQVRGAVSEEVVRLDYESITMTYYYQKPDGTSGGQYEYSWTRGTPSTARRPR